MAGLLDLVNKLKNCESVNPNCQDCQQFHTRPQIFLKAMSLSLYLSPSLSLYLSLFGINI